MACKIFEELKEEALNAAGALVGYAELVGLRYPVKSYRLKLDERVTRGSRIDDLKGYIALKGDGYHGLVDLRKEGPGDVGYGAEKAGLICRRIPIIDNTPPSLQDVMQFLAFVAEADVQPVYFHCEKGTGRTGVMAAMYRVACMGWPVDKALAEAKTFGLMVPDQEEDITAIGEAILRGEIPGYPVKPGP